MKRNNYIIALLFITAVIFFIVDFNDDEESRTFKDLFGKQEQLNYQKVSGQIFGTWYNIIYADPQNRDLQAAILDTLNLFNQSLSTYDKNSTISRFNQSEQGISPDNYLTQVFIRANEISNKTSGAFDMTVAPLVNYWGFGFTLEDVQQKVFAQSDIDSILDFVGYQNVRLENGTLSKSDFRTQLDASAIAKGFGVDVAAALLTNKGIKNYMVEIGGEVVTAGKNKTGVPWKIGITKPVDSPIPVDNKLQAIVGISGKALASSGNYRQFYMKDGKKYSHTINPKTGYPVEHNLLATSVIANDCMTADAYATACMVMGVEESLKLAKQTPEIEVYLIYEDANHEINVKFTDGFKTYILE